MLLDQLFEKLALVLGLGFFFGLAFEDFYRRNGATRPGGIRTFPLLALIGAGLQAISPGNPLPLCTGLAILGGLLGLYYWQHLAELDEEGHPNVGLVVPLASILAFLIGPIGLTQPAWAAIGITVAAVLLLTARERLHGLAQRIELVEIVTAGKFLALTGLIMPLLPDRPITSLTALTPHQVWLAVLAVCTVSYASYLLQRYIAPAGGLLFGAILGGLYSSTATTVVLARRVAAEPATRVQAQSGIVATTAIMNLRLLAIVLVFNRPLAWALMPPLLALAVVGGGIALGLQYRRNTAMANASVSPANPLELPAALIFAILFVAVSILSAWVKGAFGAAGVYAFAAVIGVADIDPFVLNMAQDGPAALMPAAAAAAILIAAASNNLLKAGYTVSFAGLRAGLLPASSLVLLACGSLGAALWMTLN
jgi:uncharacterized membrane protein (DUF4010 family)